MREYVIILLVLLLLTGCSTGITHRRIQGQMDDLQGAIVLNPVLGTSMMQVPKGTLIGQHRAPEDGIFMTKKVFLEMIAEVVTKMKKRYEIGYQD